VVALEAKKFLFSLRLLNDCLSYVQVGQSIANANKDGAEEETFSTDLEMRQDECLTMLAVADSLREIQNTDNMVAKIPEDFDVEEFEESEYAPFIWDIVDRYRHALILTRTRDVEIEAIAHARLGKVFGLFVGNMQRARENLKISLELADSLRPKIVSHNEWHKEATRLLQQFQQEQVEEEQRAADEGRSDILELLKTELANLRTIYNECIQVYNDENTIKFMKYLYTTHPPKNAEHTFDSAFEGAKPVKKALRLTILHYHPDKQPKSGEGARKWSVLCEEITKRLNFFNSC